MALFKKATIDNSTNPALEHVYTDITGNKWYALKNIMDISASRGVTAARADRYVGMRLSQDNLKALLKKALDGVNSNTPDIAGAIAILHEINFRQQFLCEENSLLDLAAVYYFLKDEDPELPSEYHNQKKVAIWDKDARCRGFFLHMGIALTKHFSDTSEKDLILFMEQAKETAQRIFQFIPRPTMPNSNLT